MQLNALMLALLFIALALAQTIDPTTVPLSTRENWCNLQTTSCPLLCPQIGGSVVPLSNTCNSTTLAFTCLCSNNATPNASQYTQTIPYLECTEAANQCAAACANGDNGCVSKCRTAHPCGAQDPPKGNHTASAAATSTMPTSTAQATGFGGPTSGAGRMGGSVGVLIAAVVCMLVGGFA